MKLREKLVIDIDGVIIPESSTGPFDKYLQVPSELVMNQIANLYFDYIIIFNTARGWNEYSLLTEWLDKYFNYDLLICGKINAKYIIDDRSFKSLDEFLEKNKG